MLNPFRIVRRKPYLALIPLCTLLLILIFFLNPAKSVHYHAGFTVYVDGAKQDFSGIQYMNYTACSEHKGNKSKAEEQIEKAHLHDGVGDVVHVHRPGGTWGDLFRNLNFTFPDNQSVVGYRQGEKISHILQERIIPDDSLMIVVGTPPTQSDYVSLDHIKEVEAGSELCGT